MKKTPQLQVLNMRFRTITTSLAALVTLGLGLVAAPSAKAQILTTLYSFCSQSNCADGAGPQAALVQATDGNFYGTTVGGGANGNYGTVFRITPDGTLNTLYSFCSQSGCMDGELPHAGLVQASDGNFYGTTQGGGANGRGTVFKITPGGGLTTLYSFCSRSGCTDGEQPDAGLVQASDGNFYGTTAFGGANGPNGGTVFKIGPDGTLTTLYSFCSQSGCTDGEYLPAGLVQGSDGNFYGMTYEGGANAHGTVFKITPGGALTTLYSFCSQSGCADGKFPYAGLVQGSDGNFYGTTAYGGASHRQDGTVFKVTPSGELTTFYSFCSQGGGACTDGANPFAGLVRGSDGNFYGTTYYGGANGFFDGMVFKLNPLGALNTLYNFCSQTGCTDGDAPYAGLVQGSDGNFYGTTQGGGANGQGTAFRLSVTGGEPIASVSPTSLSFHQEVINTTSYGKTVLLSSTGTSNLLISGFTFSGANASDFAETNNCAATMGPGAKCVINVTFTPSVLGAESATLDVNDNAANSPQTVALSGTAVLPVVLAPTSLNFGNQAEDTMSASKAVTLTNNLSTDLAISSVTASGDFAQTNTCGTSVPAKGTCKINVRFTPTILGTRTGTLTVTDSASNSPQTASLAGTGVAQVTLNHTSLVFGTLTVGTTSAPKSVTLKNNLNSVLTITSIAASGDFAETNTCGGSVPALGTCTINVTFTPTQKGPRTGTLTVTDSANNSPQTASLTGTGK